MSSSSSTSASSAPPAASASVPAWIATAPPAFLKAAGPFTGPVPVPKDNSAVNVLITGAARGIGFELTREYAAANSASIVFAGVRDPQAVSIVSLAAQYTNIVILPLDVTSDESIKQSVAQVSKLVDHLDILVNNAAVGGVPEQPTVISRDSLLSILNINTASPMVVTQAYLPLLKLATKRSARVINVSSGMGSNAWASTCMSAFGSGFSTGYSVSKAALNYVTSVFAPAVPEIIFISVSPGVVQTDMGGAAASVKGKDCVQALRALIESRELKHSGLFFDNIDNGAQLPF